MTESLADPFNSHRLLLFYKGDISALTLFLQQASGSVFFPEPLPPLSEALEEDDDAPTGKVSVHPAMLLSTANQILQLDNDLLRIEAGYAEQVDAPGGLITVYMARFTLLDPPHLLMESRNCKFRTLPELRGRPPAEMELLRRAYVKMMEG